jgi:hypothetical protein
MTTCGRHRAAIDYLAHIKKSPLQILVGATIAFRNAFHAPWWWWKARPLQH